MQRVGCIALRPLYAPRNLRGPWWWTKLSPPSASSAAATTYSCSAVRGAVGACVAAGWRGCVSRQGTWGSSCAGHATKRPMVMAATADASAVRSAGLYCLSPVVSRARCLQAAVQATAPQVVQSGSAPSAPSLPLCCTVVAVSSGGALLQRLRALPRREGGRDWLREALRASALRVHVVRVLPAVLRGPPVVGRGVGVGTSGRARQTGCGALATVPPRLLGARPRRGAANPGSPGGGTCPRVGCGSAGKAPAAAPAPGLAPRR